MITPTEFIRRFRNINKIKMIDGWKNISTYPFEGGCSDFALTVLLLIEGSWIRVFWAILTFRAVFWLTKSENNYWFWPRHVVLWHKDYGWIDSTEQVWRATVTPHRKVLPIPFFWAWVRIIWGGVWKFGKKLVDAIRN